MTHRTVFDSLSLDRKFFFLRRVVLTLGSGLASVIFLLAPSGCSSGSSGAPGVTPNGGTPGVGGSGNVAGAANGGTTSAGNGSTAAGTGQGGSSAGAAGGPSAGGQPASVGGEPGMAGQANAGGPSAGGDGGHGGASGAGTGGVGGGGGAGTYNPCPAKGTVCRIMPMGDSITEGFRATDNRGGYKSRLFHLTLLNKQSITFVGSAPLWGPDTVDGVAFPKQNEGIGGRRIEALINIVPAVSTASKPNTIIVNKPHILLLEIGTNNIGDGATSMSSKLGTLLDMIIASDPNLLVVLAKTIPTKTASENVTVKAYDDLMPAMVKARADAGKHIILTDMYAAMMSNPNYASALMTDDFHPNDAGYTVMAQTWYDAIKTYLP